MRYRPHMFLALGLVRFEPPWGYLRDTLTNTGKTMKPYFRQGRSPMTQMTKRTADRPADTVAPTPGVGSPAQSGLHINPATGLCSDYLNHFNEAIMVLEMLPAVPDCVDDFFA